MREALFPDYSSALVVGHGVTEEVGGEILKVATSRVELETALTE